MLKSKKEKLDKEKLKNEMKEFEVPIKDAAAKDKNETELTETELTEAELNSAKETALEEQKNDENRINELEKQIAVLRDQYLRKVAEFENYKRRTDNEKTEFFAYANEKLIGELLSVIDDFERALKAYNDKHDAESLNKGVELINGKFKKILEKQGLKEINSAPGDEFDVHLHEALMQQPSGEIEPNKVIDTIEKGYYLKDKVIRHAKVVVSANPE